MNHYVLEIAWDASGLPSLVGPFGTQSEAEDWGAQNIPNGSWNVAPPIRPATFNRN